MLTNIRRSIANKISPDKSHSYPIGVLKLATAQEANRSSLRRAHANFVREHGRTAFDDAEAWKWDREQLNKTLIELGHEPGGTEFIPSAFYESSNGKQD